MCLLSRRWFNVTEKHASETKIDLSLVRLWCMVHTFGSPNTKEYIWVYQWYLSQYEVFCMHMQHNRACLSCSGAGFHLTGSSAVTTAVKGPNLEEVGCFPSQVEILFLTLPELASIKMTSTGISWALIDSCALVLLDSRMETSTYTPRHIPLDINPLDIWHLAKKNQKT